MINPFKLQDAMLPIASLNQVIVDGQKSNDRFSPLLIMRALGEITDHYGITPLSHDLQGLMETLSHHPNHEVHEAFIRVGEYFGDQLAKLLFTLLNADDKVKMENLRWKDEHWDYWKTIKSIYLMGGVASSAFKPIFMKRINMLFDQHGLDDVQVFMPDDTQDQALYGMANRFDRGSFLLFDFGQTFIKRAYVRRMSGQNMIERKLEHMPAKHLEPADPDHFMAHAFELHHYILEILKDTIQELMDPDIDLLISMANYVKKGELNPGRSSYGMLSVLSTNYQDYLEQELNKHLNRNIHVYLEHDTTAMAHSVPQQPHTAVITLGTAFGISFIDE